MATRYSVAAVLAWLLVIHVWSCSSSSQLPVGHLLSLGHHRPPDKEIDAYDHILSPEVFWEQYASRRKPVVFRGAANQWEAMRLWTDEYLSEHFGQLEVKLEGKREKFGKIPVGAVGVGRDTIGNFLKTWVQYMKDIHCFAELQGFHTFRSAGQAFRVQYCFLHSFQQVLAYPIRTAWSIAPPQRK